MARFTPGPWIAVKEAGDEWWFGGRGQGQIVFRAEGGKSHDSIGVLGYTESGDPEQEANARLIAAAPCMYAALEELLEAVRLYEVHATIGDDTDAFRDACLRLSQARNATNAALAKARAADAAMGEGA